MSNSLSVVHPELIVEWSKKNLPLRRDLSRVFFPYCKDK